MSSAEPPRDPQSTAASWARWADEQYCYLTTTGRVTGRPHRIEIWFGIDQDTLYMLSGGGERSDWLKAVGHARGPLPARWIEEGWTSVLREGGFPRRPRVSEDDRLVLYASVWRRVFGLVVAIGEAYRVDHPRWPWRIAVEPLLLVPDLDLAPPVESIGVAARSMSQQSHIRLEPDHYRQAIETLSSIAL